jgi:hypothetical protein
MNRYSFLERNLIQIYGGFPTDDAEVNFDLLNAWLPDAIGTAAKTCYKEAVQLDGIGYVNNGFYSTFSGIAITTDDTDNLCYKLTLPEIPVGIGRNEGVSALRFKDSSGFVSLTTIFLSMNQQAYADSMRPIPNKILAWPEGNTIRMKTALQLFNYTGVVKMISGGDGADLNSELNVPPDYFPIMVEYLKQQLMAQRSVKQDTTNDGLDMQ